MERKGICPICNGTGRKPASKEARAHGWYGYDKNTDTQSCHNCGSHGMFAPPPDGKVELRPDGTPCEHHFTSQTIGRCYHRYTCKHCNTSYSIDSGD